jgi:hypothetical protein
MGYLRITSVHLRGPRKCRAGNRNSGKPPDPTRELGDPRIRARRESHLRHQPAPSARQSTASSPPGADGRAVSGAIASGPPWPGTVLRSWPVRAQARSPDQPSSGVGPPRCTRPHGRRVALSAPASGASCGGPAEAGGREYRPRPRVRPGPPPAASRRIAASRSPATRTSWRARRRRCCEPRRHSSRRISSRSAASWPASSSSGWVASRSRQS